MISAAVVSKKPLNEFDLGDQNKSYSAYLKSYENMIVANPEENVIKARNFSAISSSGETGIVEKLYGRENVLKIEKDLKYVEYVFNVQSEGLYEIGLTHYALNTDVVKYMIGFMINGKTPFYGAANIILNNNYRSKSKEPIVDENGNQFASEYIINDAWTRQTLRNSAENIDDPLKFYFQKGDNTLRIIFSQAYGLAISDVFIRGILKPLTYAQYIEQINKKGKGNKLLQIEAESSVLQSNSTVRPFAERTDPLMSPYNADNLVLNCIGSDWSEQGQWLEWNITVKESGWYRISFRYLQDILKGIGSRRKISIDGIVPFKELGCIRFPYTEKWNLFTPSADDGTPYEIYIDAGKTHTLRIEVVLGDLVPIINEVDSIVYELNAIYRKIIMITSINPDRYRDYNLESELPSLLGDIEDYANRVQKCSKKILDISNGNIADSAILNTLERQLRNFIVDPKTIPYRVQSLQNNVGSVSAWSLNLRHQPLALDYFTLWQSDAKLPKARANLWDSTIHVVRSFVSSFVHDYSNFSTKKEGDTISLWFGGGRNQAEILWKMTNDLFTPQTNINVNIKLVSATIVEAFLSGKSPDIAINLSRETPINLALRGAVADLSSFDDFKEATNQFSSGALVPYTYENCVYGLPDSQVFNVLFYRKDVLSELGIRVPKTWDELIKTANQLHLFNLETGITGDGDASTYYALLMQKGANVFNDNLSATLLNTQVSLNAFTQWTDMYNKTGLPLSYSLFNRFRSGEMPIVIAPYSMYGQFEAAAPEIRGLWGMALVPGTPDGKGEINNTISATGTAAVILQTSKNPKSGWKFIKWWTGAEAQERYSRDVESRLGIISRVTLANVEAFKKQDWPQDVFSILNEQRSFIKEIPQVPGQYYLDRDLINAFRDVVYKKTNPFETILKYSKRINDEIGRKREELALD
jgi:ABC-type glycerol-3-phosphate transport system substrate-binding protein